MPPIFVLGVGHFHPPTVITNQFLESLDIGTTVDWITHRLGIRERRTVLSLDYIRQTRNADVRAAGEASSHSNTDAAEAAVKMALDRAGVSAGQIGLVLSGSSCAVHQSPPEACLVANRLGIAPVCFDVSAACNTFLAQASVAKGWMVNQACEFALLIQAEQLTRAVDYNERTTASLMGDATTAVVVSRTVGARRTLENIRIATRPTGWEAAVIPAGRHFRQHSASVREFATTHLAQGIPQEHDSWTIFHQANLRLIEAVARGVGIRPEHHLYNVDRFGNCGTAGAVSVLSEHWEKLQDEPGPVGLSAVGAGLGYGSAILRRDLG